MGSKRTSVKCVAALLLLVLLAMFSACDAEREPFAQSSDSTLINTNTASSTSRGNSETQVEQSSSSFAAESAPPSTPDEHESGNVQPDTWLPRDSDSKFKTTAELNFRTGPDTGYESMRLIPQGTVVRELGRLTGNDGWLYVNYDGATGWVSMDWIVPLGGVPAAPPAVAASTVPEDMAAFLQNLGRWHWGDEHKIQSTSKENRESLLPVTRQKLAELVTAGAIPQTFADKMTAYLDGDGINYSRYSDGATREMLTCNFGMGTSPTYYISMNYRLETGQVYSLDSSLPFQHSFLPEELDAMLQGFLAYSGLDALGDWAYTEMLPNIRLLESPSAGLVAGIAVHNDINTGNEKENMIFTIIVRVQD